MSASDRKPQLPTGAPSDPAPAQRTIDPAELRAFARRDYALLERQKEEHRARQYAELLAYQSDRMPALARALERVGLAGR
jgi:hypothetical protein